MARSPSEAPASLSVLPIRGVVLVLVIIIISGAGCKKSSNVVNPSAESRSYRMGFSGFPPRFDFAIAVASIDMWVPRADAAIISEEPPWDSLLAGILPETLITRDKLQLCQYYRSKGHHLWVYLDPGNGLNRSGESDALVRRGRSITASSVQQVYRRYAVVIDSMLRPEHLGLALETNMIRGASPPSLYAAIKKVANDAAGDVRTRDSAVKLSISVQVDYAWGRFGGQYQGVETDFSDFPFIQELGLSSYPYLAGFNEPEEIPTDYYSRLGSGHTVPLMITEGGWTSATLDTLVSSEDKQRRYIVRHSQILAAARAVAVFQLTFTDIDIAAIQLPPGSILPLFAHLGLVTVDLKPKAALSAWDEVFARPRR
jgi:hypothetical protein